MQLRYNYRLYPTPGQRAALTRAFGCARVVFNDALRARQDAHAAGLGYLTDAELSARLTAAKATPERAWLGEVSSVVLQQALADLNAAYRNFFASITGKRKGAKVGPPRFKSRKDRRQAVRFTANARFKILANGPLRLPGVGDIQVRWSRDLPSDPSSVTVIKDAAGRYLASFVVETDPSADIARFPARDSPEGPGWPVPARRGHGHHRGDPLRYRLGIQCHRHRHQCVVLCDRFADARPGVPGHASGRNRERLGPAPLEPAHSDGISGRDDRRRLTRHRPGRGSAGARVRGSGTDLRRCCHGVD